MLDMRLDMRIYSAALYIRTSNRRAALYIRISNRLERHEAYRKRFFYIYTNIFFFYSAARRIYSAARRLERHEASICVYSVQHVLHCIYAYPIVWNATKHIESKNLSEMSWNIRHIPAHATSV
jgi:hypothetical protein